MTTAISPNPLPIAVLQALDHAGFVVRLGGVVEHSPWVVERAWVQAPFTSFSALFETLCQCIHDATRPEKIALLCAHPELAGREAVAGTMTPDSSAEQARLGLMALSPQTMARLAALNRAYQARFDFPFIVALRLHDSLASVLQAGEERLRHDPDTEWPIALNQVCEVMRGRLARAVHDDDCPPATPPSPVSTASRTLP
ncbi:MAG: 2-oxo-4-hydroxy-4-carboxy-5-ureidoimidazoline decarboxylase [Comamonadaceae bacterium]|jgi:2-oxo-4-hydroxy-4-carboxy-5-ureidoimidazoline decarboxylase|uniref:2-oxo-4-hydroxy-4-carboxy-5-ureidoimidazoline decarboxylase n=1 Tax=Candidatus Skiveiella danica TaxID=3386177 RepID=UPI001E138CF6|nr:2-oxo-4-hydroxy-4-carboxy-5-ureidoimidazoline decarboxylase [Comamonadaceae bacterium]MBK8358442.1 2-oxo-4-hydroxy-4-carboxy-5-ureidoimidazoline decarboxylase [Comamonadaceae bacterium]MBK9200073.1 2-oxo-4-hydroxy-4-carboxy-5-ureidoimidazoline decarboxylase [Betaproteobacteria bacterium]